MSEAHELQTIRRREPRRTAVGASRARAFVPWLPYVLAFVVALGVYLAAFDHIRAQLPTGDEPSYVLDAFSMARDHDRDLSNQYSDRDPERTRVLFGVPVAPHGQRYTSAGFISWHGAGLGFALVPGVWVGDALGDPLLWMRLELVLIDALCALALFALLRQVGSILGYRSLAVWAAWASVALCLILVAYADQFYPEVLALLCTVLALNVAVRRRPSVWLLAAGAAAASYLPWLHVRFIPVCFGLLAALALRGVAARAPATRGRLLPSRAEIGATLRTGFSRSGLPVLAAVAVPAILSFGFMAYKFQYWYGSPNWQAMTVPGPPAGGGLDAWYFNVLGGLFGTDYGWMPFAPVFLLALAALGCLWLVAPRWTTYALVIVVAYQYLLGSTAITTPGFVFPGRYEIVCVPLLGLALLVVLARLRVVWLAFLPLFALTLALTYQASQRTGFVLLNTGTVGLPLAAHLASAFPDIEQPVQGTAFDAEQSSQIHTVGRLVDKGRVAVARPSDGEGYLTAGPGAPLAPGTYVAGFQVGQRGGHGMAPLVTLQAWSIPGVTMAERPLNAADLPPGRTVRVELPFATPGGLAVETRAHVFGRATVRVGPIDVRAVTLSLAPPFNDAHPNAGLMALWVFGELFLGVLLMALLLAQRRPPRALS